MATRDIAHSCTRRRRVNTFTWVRDAASEVYLYIQDVIRGTRSSSSLGQFNVFGSEQAKQQVTGSPPRHSAAPTASRTLHGGLNLSMKSSCSASRPYTRLFDSIFPFSGYYCFMSINHPSMQDAALQHAYNLPLRMPHSDKVDCKTCQWTTGTRTGLQFFIEN